MLIGDVVVYERHSLPGENRWADVALHEAMHLSVRKGQAYKSEGVWLTAKRDVPTAALRTYHQYLQRAREKGISPPRSLGFLSDHGRTAMGQRAHGIGDHIANMLDYFAVLKEESNAAYVCAAILAGVLDVLLQGDDQLIENYISHLVVVDHVTAWTRLGAECLCNFSPTYSVRPNDVNHQWRKIPPGGLSTPMRGNRGRERPSLSKRHFGPDCVVPKFLATHFPKLVRSPVADRLSKLA